MLITNFRDSLLTTSSGYTNYRGILNLVIILLVLSNARAALENVIKYGILVDPISWILFLADSTHWPALLIAISMLGHILVSVAIEKLIAAPYYCGNHLHQNNSTGKQKSDKKCDDTMMVNGDDVDEKKMRRKQQQQQVKTNQSIMLFANSTIILNLFACISLPALTVYCNDTNPFSTSGSLMIVAIVFLKLVSYHMMNYWCRQLFLPEKMRSTTARSFLRLYIAPVVDFRNELILDSNKLNNSNNITTNGKNSSTNASNNNTSKLTSTNELKNVKKLSPPPVTTTTTTNLKETTTATLANGHNQEYDKEQLREMSLDVLRKYPENITVKNMYHYMLYPTLCYELEYAVTKRIRKRFLIKRLIELVILSQLDLALIQQWIIPTVSNSVIPFRQMQFSHMLERLLKLAIPNHVIWLIWFYFFFHSLLNIVAELTRFADREFYRDWWNSESVSYFWSNWNIPVHKWCMRHLYLPLIAMGLSKCQASTAVFFVSAFFHEYLVSVPLKLFRMWAFTGMLIQLPWARFVSAYFNNNFANVAVWVSLIIGQPLCILMYYHDYYVINTVKSMPSR